MDTLNDIHQTARDWFLARIVNGAIPEIWEGIRYFPLTLDGVDYLLTADGLFTPPEQQTTPTE
ncbi:MAG: hypothetical protein WBI91_03575 [Coriobacteriia bacterium]